MTIVAIRKLFVDLPHMRETMTGHTLRNPLMLILMTINTTQLMMLAGIFIQIGGFDRMAAGTEPGRHISVVGNFLRHVRWMATDTIVIDHRRHMRLVTFQTFQELTVPWMAFFTIQQRMAARILFQLLGLMGMAGSAGRIDAPRMGVVNLHGPMSRMAFPATGHGEVNVVSGFMAHGTFGNGLGTTGGMLDMTIHAGHGGLVFAPVEIDILDLLFVAFPAVFGHQIEQNAFRPHRRCSGQTPPGNRRQQ